MSLPSTSNPGIPFKNQVGGHAGVQTTEDGSLIIKPALPLEHKFYQELTSTTHARLRELRPFVPKFFGTLRLEGVVDRDGSGSVEGGGIGIAVVKEVEVEGEVVQDHLGVDPNQKDEFSRLGGNHFLENLSHPFRKPNILDVKLGTVLYDEDSPPEKVERMKKVAKETTSEESGVRLTGFQVYDNSTSQPVVTGKAYGKSIKVSELPEGIRRVFPIAPSATDDPPSPSLGLPAHLLLPILEYLKADIEELREIFAELELRMVGASLLIIYEGDITKAEEDLKWVEEDKDDDEEDVDDGGDADADADANEDEDDEDDNPQNRPGPPYVVKLIDFAHTRIKPGEGPDEGVLKGMDTLVRLIQGRIEEVEKYIRDKGDEKK